ncbi:761_t:CDS:2 [Entrophospora sp. SA101]|nr:761_t:CDS:2 [Entrophospora sp. SA101]
MITLGPGQEHWVIIVVEEIDFRATHFFDLNASFTLPTEEHQEVCIKPNDDETILKLEKIVKFLGHLHNTNYTCCDFYDELTMIAKIPINNTMPKEGFTHCVVIDKIDGVIQQCKSTNKMRRLGQLVGAWEVDETAVRNCDDVVNELGVCYEHFLYDQNSIHSARVKQDVNIEKSGHLEPRPRKGPPFKLCNDHDNDASSSLQYISKWILEVSHGSDQEYKKKVLNYLVPSLAVFNKDSSKFPENVKTEPSESTQSEQSEEIKVPHLFLIKTILKLAKVNLTDEERASNLTSGEFYNQGKTLALAIWKNKNILSENSEQLSQPESLEKYINAFPPCLTSFFGGMVETINIKKQLQRRNQIPDPNNNQTIKTTAFLSSVVITNAFKKRKIWITQILATLCRKPKLLSSLYQVLLAGGVLPHTLRHERRCEDELMMAADPRKNLDLLSDEAEFQNRYNKRLDLVADEAIFRRLVRYNKDHPEVIPMLGQFHTKRLDTFLSEFLDDDVKIRSEKATHSRKESLWQVIDELCNIFDGTTPLDHSLFKNLKELHDEGLNNIFTCYDKGIERLYTLLNVEVLGNIKTRASSKKDIISHKWTDISKDNNKSKKGKKSNLNEQPIPMIIDNDDIQNASSSTSDAPPLQAKKPKHMASPAEKEILRHLASFQETLPNDAIDSVLESLFQLDPNYWDKKKVKDYWRLNLGPNKRKKKSEMDMES